MPIQLTEQQLRDIRWIHTDSELVHADVRPEERETTVDPVDGEEWEFAVEPAVSQAFGFSVLSGTAPDGTTIELGIDWASSGDTRGTFADLYDWDVPEINEQGSSDPVQITSPDVVLLDEDGEAMDSRQAYEVLEDVAREAEGVWQPHAAATLPECPEPEELDAAEYIVLLLRPGEDHAHRRQRVRGWSEAVATAHQLVASYFDEHEVVWCGADGWSEHDEAAPGLRPLGGYDAGPADAETASSVIYGSDEDVDMDTITLPRDNDRDVRFAGEQVAVASSYDVGNDIRWTEIVLYRTRAGTWVAHVIGHTRWQGERTRYSVHIAESDEDLVGQLGTGRLAKDIYADAGIDAAEEVE